ncbi:MAG: type II toxin-antitoxin system prevent-host-death family antitoxin [Campylobacterota bacterium]|nr:type II toxin-antitoxin system prevent-host-death family antitoxin [Campylobacterota bacterium]
MTITANEVKTKGVSLFGSMLEKFDELIINVRGKDKFVVIDIERYRELRENELDLAYFQAMQDIKEGKFKQVSADEHIEKLHHELSNH